MEPSNQAALLPFLRRVREAFPQKDIWCYTGFTYEALTREGSHCRCDATEALLSQIDVLVDGPFVEELKDLRLRFRGSRNQRLIDLAATRASGTITQVSQEHQRTNSNQEGAI